MEPPQPKTITHMHPEPVSEVFLTNGTILRQTHYGTTPRDSPLIESSAEYSPLLAGSARKASGDLSLKLHQDHYTKDGDSQQQHPLGDENNRNRNTEGGKAKSPYMLIKSPSNDSMEPLLPAVMSPPSANPRITIDASAKTSGISSAVSGGGGENAANLSSDEDADSLFAQNRTLAPARVAVLGGNISGNNPKKSLFDDDYEDGGKDQVYSMFSSATDNGASGEDKPRRSERVDSAEEEKDDSRTNTKLLDAKVNTSAAIKSGKSNNSTLIRQQRLKQQNDVDTDQANRSKNATVSVIVQPKRRTLKVTSPVGSDVGSGRVDCETVTSKGEGPVSRMTHRSGGFTEFSASPSTSRRQSSSPSSSSHNVNVERVEYLTPNEVKAMQVARRRRNEWESRIKAAKDADADGLASPRMLRRGSASPHQLVEEALDISENHFGKTASGGAKFVGKGSATSGKKNSSLGNATNLRAKVTKGKKHLRNQILKRLVQSNVESSEEEPDTKQRGGRKVPVTSLGEDTRKSPTPSSSFKPVKIEQDIPAHEHPLHQGSIGSRSQGLGVNDGSLSPESPIKLKNKKNAASVGPDFNRIKKMGHRRMKSAPLRMGSSFYNGGAAATGDRDVPSELTPESPFVYISPAPQTESSAYHEDLTPSSRSRSYSTGNNMKKLTKGSVGGQNELSRLAELVVQEDRRDAERDVPEVLQVKLYFFY